MSLKSERDPLQEKKWTALRHRNNVDEILRYMESFTAVHDPQVCVNQIFLSRFIYNVFKNQTLIVTCNILKSFHHRLCHRESFDIIFIKLTSGWMWNKSFVNKSTCRFIACYTTVVESAGDPERPCQHGSAALWLHGGLRDYPPHRPAVLRHQTDLEEDLLQPRPLLRVRTPCFDSPGPLTPTHAFFL